MAVQNDCIHSWETVHSKDTIFNRTGIITNLFYKYGRGEPYLIQFEILSVSDQFIKVRVLEESIERLDLPKDYFKPRRKKLKDKDYIYFKWDKFDYDMIPRVLEEECVRDKEFPQGFNFEFADWDYYPKSWREKILKK
tara:strand:- start:134 stop:547 length:414 start_codon:yes stop_codon:yes gene_type:complete